MFPSVEFTKTVYLLLFDIAEMFHFEKSRASSFTASDAVFYCMASQNWQAGSCQKTDWLSFQWRMFYHRRCSKLGLMGIWSTWCTERCFWPWQRCVTWWYLRIPFNPNHFTILEFLCVLGSISWKYSISGRAFSNLVSQDFFSRLLSCLLD